MRSREEVLQKFTEGLVIWEREGERQRRMADEIVRLCSILTKLREPSDTMLNAMSVAAEKANVWVNTAPVTSQELQNRLWIAGMNAAIAVAEQEANRGISG